MNTPEFRNIEIQIREEKLLRIKWDENRKRSMEKQRYRAKMSDRGETPGGMPLYQRDGRTIPQSSGHEEEGDGLDARDTI